MVGSAAGPLSTSCQLSLSSTKGSSSHPGDRATHEAKIAPINHPVFIGCSITAARWMSWPKLYPYP